jgi:hypothetical protein
LLWSTPALAEVERYALIAGNNRGASDEQDLRYAEEDAKKMADVLFELGDFAPENVIVIGGRDSSTVRRSLVALNDRIRARVEDPAIEPLLFVYYSGHADARALHLDGTELLLEELEQLVRGSAAKYRVLLVDACRSGALTKVKGGEPAPPFPIHIEERLSGEGTVFLTSSSAHEDAQESDELKGSFFTHYFVSGLLGAADGDRDERISLREAYAYAYESTLRASSRTLHGTQHPTFQYDVRGRNDLILTDVSTRERRSLLELPSDRSFLVMLGSADGPVIAEVGASDRARTLSVKPGSYFLRSRSRDHLLEGTIEAPPGGRATVSERALDRIEYARLVRKGHGTSELSHGPFIGYRGRTPLFSRAHFCQGATIGYSIDLELVSLVPNVSLCSSSFSNTFVEVVTQELEVVLEVTHTFDFPYVSLEIGLGVGPAFLHQQFKTTGVAPNRWTGAGEASASLAVHLDLTHGVFAGIDGSGLIYVLRRESSAGAIELTAAPGAAFSIFAGKRW